METLLNTLSTTSASKQLVKMEDLEKGEEYDIIHARRCSTKFGLTIRLELENNMVFLPHRFDILNDEQLLDLKNFYITYIGENPTFATNNMSGKHIIHFHKK